MKRHAVLIGVSLAVVASAAAASVAAAQPAAPRLNVVRELQISGTTHDLVTMSAVLVLANGTMVVDQDQDGAIRYFGRDGAPLHKFGRQGDGPGEFRRVRYIGLAGDSVWAFDVSQARVTHLTPDYKVARTTQLSRGEPGPGFASTLPPFPFIYIKAAYPGGTYLVQGDPGFRTPRPPSYPNDKNPWVRLNESGVVQSVVTWTRDSPSSFQVVTPTTLYGATVPFTQGDLEDVSDDGRHIAFSRVTLRGSGGGTFRITMLNARGDTVYSREYPFQGVVIPRAIYDSTWNAALSRSRDRAPEVAAAIRAAGPPPTIYPPLLSLTAGRDGSAWIQMRQPGLGAQEKFWLVLDPKGEPFGTVVAPRTLTITTADLSNFWGFERDADDVQSIVRYRLSRPGQ